VANRREEERERLREARQERESSQAKSEKRRLLFVYGGTGLVGLLVIGGIVAAIASSGGGGGGEAHINQESGSTNGVQPDERSGSAPAKVKVANLQQAARQAGCDLRLKLKDEGHNHISRTAPPPNYKTNPPTSGNHVEAPYQQADGAYSEMPGEIFMVHSLEHGRIIVWAKPSLPVEAREQLRALYEQDKYQLIFVRRANMPYAVAATAWSHDPTPDGTGRLMGCPKWDDGVIDALRAFRDEHRSNGPEDIP